MASAVLWLFVALADAVPSTSVRAFTAGNFFNYTYDDLGQLRTAYGYEPNFTARLHERFLNLYDAAGNLYRLTRVPVETFGVNTLNEITNVTRSSLGVVAGAVAGGATNVNVWANGADWGAAALYGDGTRARSGTFADGSNSFTAIATDAYGATDTNVVNVFLPVSRDFVYDLNGNLTGDGRRFFEGR